MLPEAIDLEDLTHALPIGLGSVSLFGVAKEHNAILAEIKDYDPLRLAATFAGLLTVPELQSNCIRIEALAHLSLARGRGTRKPNDKIVARLFAEFGKGSLGLQEDPAEDVFVSLIQSPRGNFRVLEGVWESSGFDLQRTLNALELIPSGPRYDHMRESVYALLKLSDAVCERAKLIRHQLGNQSPEETLDRKTISSLSALRRLARFTDDDLSELGISSAHLAEFGFNPNERSSLDQETIGQSSLERFPVVYRNGEYFLLLPTAVSPAIRRYVVEDMHAHGLRDVFASTLAYEYAQLFADTPLLGTRSGAEVEFKNTDDGLLAGVMSAADRGLYVNFVFFADTLEGFEDGGLMGVYPPGDCSKLDAMIERWIDEAYSKASQQTDFRECLTILVGCGIGRAITVGMPKKRANWRCQFIGAPDLVTLSWLRDFKPISLWRISDSQSRLRKLGVTLQNINGLLNIVGWARSLGGHLVPHGDMPEEFVDPERPAFIMIQQNAIRDVRHEVVAHWDAHVVQDQSGAWIKVLKEGTSLFKEDEALPFFTADEARSERHWPRGVYESDTRSWWVELSTLPEASGYWAYERTKMLKTWLCRIVPILEAALPQLPLGPLVWRVEFAGEIGDKQSKGEREYLTYEAALSSISMEAQESSGRVVLTADPEFEDAFYHPENIAERALVERSVDGFIALANAPLTCEARDALVDSIVQDSSARQTHSFMARRFRDFVRDSIWRSPIKVDADDSAWLQLGLGWRKRSVLEGSNVQGRENCTAYLNATVRDLEDEVCGDLRQLDRRTVIMFALQNHESAMSDRDNWRRTSAAVLALHRNKEATLQTIAEHESKLNAVFHASRLLIEFAVCECPLSGGRKPGRLDMSRLMAKVLSISSYGGWSAAIHWEAMEPKLRITPLGDIQASVSFREEILEPYGRAGIDLTVDEAVKNYAKNLEEPAIRLTDESTIAAEFWEALHEQSGAPLDATRKFIDKIENIGIEKHRAIYTMTKSEVVSVTGAEDGVGLDTANALIDFLIFKPRASWREVPPEFDERDRFPWRFRRRLSVLRRPLIQLDDEPDPTMIVAPGILRDAFVYMVGNYHRGDFPLLQLKPKMKAWAGRSRDRIGHEFNESVAERMRELGWQAETEVAVTKLLRKGFDQNFGDVDVLAWRADSKRVLLMECKDVQHRKIEGEIAEQLSDFRGEPRPDGKPDLLLRHLKRVEVISKYPNDVAAYVGFEASKIEAHLVFKNPVPMKFAWKRMEARIALHLLSGLEII